MALPYFFSGIVILFVAIVGLMTKRSDLAVVTGLVSSICFYLIIGDALLLALCIVFASLVGFAVLE